MSGAARILMLLAGLAGAAGVGLAALAAHGGPPNAAPASQMLLAHAPALLALALWRGSSFRGGRPLLAGAICLALGVTLFAGTLILRDMTGLSPFAMAAPLSGLLMIAGWLVLAGAALWPRRAAPAPRDP